MIVNISLIVLALAALTTAIVAIVVGSRLTRFLRSAETLVQDSDQVVRRLHGVVEESERVARDARRVEQRVTGMIEPLLEQVEPPLRIARSLIVGLRAGLGAFFRADGSKPESDSTPPSRIPSAEANHGR